MIYIPNILADLNIYLSTCYRLHHLIILLALIELLLSTT